MLPNLDRKLLRDLNRMKGQVVAVALVMACGLAMLVMARSLIFSLESTRQEYYEAQRFAEVFAHLKRAPNALAARLAEVPGVAARTISPCSPSGTSSAISKRALGPGDSSSRIVSVAVEGSPIV